LGTAVCYAGGARRAGAGKIGPLCDYWLRRVADRADRNGLRLQRTDQWQPAAATGPVDTLPALLAGAWLARFDHCRNAGFGHAGGFYYHAAVDFASSFCLSAKREAAPDFPDHVGDSRHLLPRNSARRCLARGRSVRPLAACPW